MEINIKRHVLPVLTPEKTPRYLPESKLSGPQSTFGRCGEMSLIPAVNRNPVPRPSTDSLFSILTELTSLKSK
jgi:hypothetical protein